MNESPLKRPLFLFGAVLAAAAAIHAADSKKETAAKSKTETKATTPKMTDAELKKKLTPMQYDVCLRSMTEPAFNNEYWDNQGLYVDVISGEALFASTAKFDSGTGWPSFFQPISKGEIEEVEDISHGMRRVEVRAKTSKAHLGHVFDDGPQPTGKRYCINSASLKFIPVAQLKPSGYEKYATLFGDKAEVAK